jgi:hypothetical protein
MYKRYYLGLDPAQIRDYAALSALEVTYAGGEDATYRLVNLERRQRLSYPDLVNWVVQALKTPALNHEVIAPPTIVLDATGVGIAVRDLLRKESAPLESVIVTAGNSKNRDPDGYHVGKARIYGKFLSAFDSGRVQLNPNLPSFEQLEHEFLAFKAQISAKGNALFEAEEGEHDDLITSIALPVWYFEEHRPQDMSYIRFVGTVKRKSYPYPRSRPASTRSSDWIFNAPSS